MLFRTHMFSVVTRALLFSLVVSLIGCSMPRPETGVTREGVRFVISAPAAKKVAVVGDFNQWDREKNLLAGPDEKGYWSGTFPLPTGRYEYLYLVNGSIWLTDPAVLSADDGLGGINSVIVVD